MHTQTYFFCILSIKADWMRIGAFFFDSDVAFLTESLIAPLRISREEIVEKMLEKNGNCVLCNIKTGIWIAGNLIFL